ncbi:NucA/NucB deoxyribonuclease domain-containing protein [Ornithinimicrobium panacihumi]|uniref:NucA/NucB deoxyribonuclease domain-containing protein n=1 Tax=Ornithinimicrobium panacihumi TaxID=2008449 RepID=UPI003F88704D
MSPAKISGSLASYRCDKVASTGGGCVFNAVPGVAAFSTVTYPQFTNHVGLALSSGLPGGIRTTSYLTRLQDSTLVSKNRATACPSSLTRPAGKSCDEYPFASTYQGAHTGGGTTARSWQGCQMPDPTRTGPTGWSRCFIDEKQNSGAGSVLSGFYTSERILQGDRFQVGFTQ